MSKYDLRYDFQDIDELLEDVKAQREDLTDKLMDGEHVFIASQNIQPVHYDLWKLNFDLFFISFGGRMSSKTKSACLTAVKMMIQGIHAYGSANFICMRYFTNTLEGSMMQEIKWALGKMGVLSEWRPVESRLRIVHKKTGSTFYFIGASDTEKVKGNMREPLVGVWLEEIQEHDEWDEIENIWVTLARTNEHSEKAVPFIITGNPSRGSGHFVSQIWTGDLKIDGAKVVKSTYLDDKLGFIKPDILQRIERFRISAPEEYNHIYLGHPSTDNENGMPLPKIDNNPDLTGALFYTGIDTAYKGKDNIITCTIAVTRDKIHIVDLRIIDKGKIIDGETFYEIAHEIHLNMMNPRMKTKRLAIDMSFGAQIYEPLSAYKKRGATYDLMGVNFQGKPTYFKTMGYTRNSIPENKRVEMYMLFREHTLHQQVYTTEAIYSRIEEQLRVMEFYTKSGGRLAMVDKKQIRKKLGKSPDEMDAVVLAFEAYKNQPRREVVF